MALSTATPGKPGSSTRDEKLQIFESLENCTTKEVEKKLSGLSGETPKIKFILELDESVAELWEKVKHLAAHRSRGQDSEVLRIVAEEWLKRNDPLRNVRERNTKTDMIKSECQRIATLSTWHKPRADSKNQRKYSAETRRQVFRKAAGQCENCGSTHALEVDHVHPVAKGGTSHAENLRILCRSCNQAEAVSHFGATKMQFFRNARGTVNPSH